MWYADVYWPYNGYHSPIYLTFEKFTYGSNRRLGFVFLRHTLVTVRNSSLADLINRHFFGIWMPRFGGIA